MHSKVKLVNSSQIWNPKKRYRINETVVYQSIIYQNSTGANTDPTLGNDWVAVVKTDSVPVIYRNDFTDSGTHSFTVPSGILIGNVFLNSVVSPSDWSQSGTLVSVPSSQTGDLVTLTGRN